MALIPGKRLSRRVCRLAFTFCFVFTIPFGLDSCLFSSREKESGVSVLKLDPGFTDTGTEKISLETAGLANGGFVVSWASHVPLPNKAWRTDWKVFDEKGDAKGEGFDWVPYPSRVIRTVVSAAPSAGFVLASIVEKEPGVVPEVYVHEIGRNSGQLDPGSITFPGVLSLSEIALLALEPLGLALAVIGSDSNHRPTLWVGRFDGQGKQDGAQFQRIIVSEDSVTNLDAVQLLPTKNGGWVCYWNESQKTRSTTINSVAFSTDSVGIPKRKSALICENSLCYGNYPSLPYGDGKILVMKSGPKPTSTFTFGPDGGALSHPDLLENINTFMPIITGNPVNHTFVTLASNNGNPLMEILLLDSNLALIQRKKIPRVYGQDMAICQTVSGKFAIISPQAPYASTSNFGLILLDPLWE